MSLSRAGLPTYTRCMIDALKALLVDSIRNSPRSAQKAVGPSELANECDLHLALRFAVGKGCSERYYQAWVGTAMHAEIARIIEATGDPRWLVEKRVTVGEVGGQMISGSCDLFDITTGTVHDHKTLGPYSLKKFRREGPQRAHIGQISLYGLGWENAGFEVNQIALWGLPREDADGFETAPYWSAPYDRSVALSVLDRANRIHDTASMFDPDELRSIFPPHPECWDCKREAKAQNFRADDPFDK